MASCLGTTGMVQLVTVDRAGAVDLGGDYVGTYGGYRTYCVKWVSWTKCTGYQTRYITVSSGVHAGCQRLYRRNVTFTVGGTISNVGAWTASNTIICT